MVIKQFDYNASINQTNNVHKEQLKRFIEEYINGHSYFKPRDIALEYLNNSHQITLNDLNKDRKIILFLTKRIAKLLKPYKLSGAIIPYNSKTYQVIK